MRREINADTADVEADVKELLYFMSAKTGVTTADENYLEAVLMIRNRIGEVRSIDLAE